MDILKSIRVKAAEWHDTNKIVEGTLFVADRITLEGADPERNQNGYLLFIVDDSGLKHIIAPDTLEIIEKEATSEVGKAVHASFMKLYKAGFTFAQVENFWKDCMSSADIMIENKKRGLQPQSSMSGVDLIYFERKRQIEVEGFTPKNDAKYTDDELAIAGAIYAFPRDKRVQTVWLKESWTDLIKLFWPWDMKFWKPTPEDRIKELAKAGALIAAEIDRLHSI